MIANAGGPLTNAILTYRLLSLPGLCYTDSMVDDTERAQLEARLIASGKRLRAWGLEGLAAALLEAAEPLSMLGAQALYLAQPALGVFLPSGTVGRWARLLEDPANLAWMRERLTGSEDAGAFPDGERGRDDPAD